ncbi:MAG: homoserine kinase [Pyrinomonadaceae bacterium]
MKTVKVLASATVANVVCGFDCLGFALEYPYDEITVSLLETPEVRIFHKDAFGLSTDAKKNVAGVALDAVISAVQNECGFEIEIKKGILPGSGIGSSAASAVGAVVAANELLDQRFSLLEQTEFALAGEFIASNSRHADNVAPCLYGGFTLVRSVSPLDVVNVQHPNLFATVIHPQIEIKTSEAREMLPNVIELNAAAKGWANVGALVAGLNTGDYELIARSLEDKIIEPVRSRLIPHFYELKYAALEAGALGGGISGSGPSVFMLSKNNEEAREVEAAMSAVFEPTGIEFNTYVSAIGQNGVKLAS